MKRLKGILALTMATIFTTGCAVNAHRVVVWEPSQNVIEYAARVAPDMTFSAFDKMRVENATKITNADAYTELNGFFFTEYKHSDIQKNFERFCEQSLGQSFRKIDGVKLAVCDDPNGRPLFLVSIKRDPKLFWGVASKVGATSYHMRVIAPSGAAQSQSYIAALNSNGYQSISKVALGKQIAAMEREMKFREVVAQRPLKKRIGIELCRYIPRSNGANPTARAFVEQVEGNRVKLRVHGHYISTTIKESIDPYITWDNVDQWKLCQI